MSFCSILCTYGTTLLLLSISNGSAHRKTAMVSNDILTGIRSIASSIADFFSGIWSWFQTTHVFQDCISQGYAVAALKFFARGFFGQSTFGHEPSTFGHVSTRGKIVIRNNSKREFELENLGCTMGNFVIFPPGLIFKKQFDVYLVENNVGSNGIVCSAVYRDTLTDHTFTLTVDSVSNNNKKAYIDMRDKRQSEIEIKLNESSGDMFQVVVLIRDKIHVKM